MEERKIKGKPVIYIPAGETFKAEDGQKYKVVPDMIMYFACSLCAFSGKSALCGRYRCVSDDRADGVGVFFERVKEENQKH